MLYEWDEKKDQENIRKHGLPLKAGVAVFDDYYRLEQRDDRNNYDEERFVTIGMNERSKILYVVYTMRNNGGATRLISVRKAEKLERRLYETSRE